MKDVIDSRMQPDNRLRRCRAGRQGRNVCSDTRRRGVHQKRICTANLVENGRGRAAEEHRRTIGRSSGDRGRTCGGVSLHREQPVGGRRTRRLDGVAHNANGIVPRQNIVEIVHARAFGGIRARDNASDEVTGPIVQFHGDTIDRLSARKADRIEGTRGTGSPSHTATIVHILKDNTLDRLGIVDCGCIRRRTQSDRFRQRTERQLRLVVDDRFVDNAGINLHQERNVGGPADGEHPAARGSAPSKSPCAEAHRDSGCPTHRADLRKVVPTDIRIAAAAAGGGAGINRSTDRNGIWHVRDLRWQLVDEHHICRSVAVGIGIVGHTNVVLQDVARGDMIAIKIRIEFRCRDLWCVQIDSSGDNPGEVLVARGVASHRRTGGTVAQNAGRKGHHSRVDALVIDITRIPGRDVYPVI